MITKSKEKWILFDGDYLEVRWNETKGYGIQFERFNRMGALLGWVERHEGEMVALCIYRKRGVKEK